VLRSAPDTTHKSPLSHAHVLPLPSLTAFAPIALRSQVRLLTNITQSLIRSYTQTKGAAPIGEMRTFLEEQMPFGGATAAWLAYTREHIGEEAFNKVWEKSVSGEKARGGPTKSL
jgi:hypothetical protein